MNLNRIHNDIHEGALQLMAEHRTQLFAKARALCDSDDEADELVIRTIDQAIRKIDTYSGKGNILSWMVSILENLRSNDRRNPVIRGTTAVDAETLERYAGADWSTEEQILRNSDSEAIRKALSGLDPKYNQVLLMRYYGEFSMKQIARVLQLPLGTVCRRMQIAHRLLAGKLRAEFGRVKRPLAIVAAVLSFTFASAAAVVATVPALAPVRDAVAAWFADEDAGGMGDGGTGVPPVHAEDVGGTGVPPVQSETVSEPEQEDTTPTQPNTTETTKGETMNINKIAAVATATLLGMAANAAESSTTSLFTQKDAPGKWGESKNWDVMPHELTEIIKFALNDGSPLGAYLKDGDNFSYANAALTVGCDSRAPNTAITTAKLTIPTNASLTVKSVSFGGNGVTGIVNVVGGKLTASEHITLNSTSLAILKVKDGEVGTVGWTKGVIEADHSIVRMKSATSYTAGGYTLLKNGSQLISKRLLLASNGGSAKLDFYAEDSQVDLSEYCKFGTDGCGGKFLTTNSTVKCGNTLTFGGNNKYAYNDATAVIDQIGTSTNLAVGAVTLNGNFRYRLAGEKAYLGGSGLEISTTRGSHTQRFDFVSGEIETTTDGLKFLGTGFTGISQKSSMRFDFFGGKITLPAGAGISMSESTVKTNLGGTCVFAMHGSTPQITLSKIVSSNTREGSRPLLMEFVIDRTGAPCIKYAYSGTTSSTTSNYRMLQGAYVAKLAGGLQLLHTNAFSFVDSHVDGVEPQNLVANGATKVNYADLNEADHHLWTFGPYGTVSKPAGVLAGTKTFGAELNEAEELEGGKRYEEGRSCGWVKLPKFKSGPASGRVMLDIEPQNGHTLAEIADGLTAAGYLAKVVSGGAYNLRVTIPPEDIRIGSENEVVAFDFAEYDSGEAVKTREPTDVRALVYQADVMQNPGLVIFLK